MPYNWRMKKNLDLPDDVADKLKAVAAESDRNLNQQIVYACRFFLAAHQRFGSVDHLLASLAAYQEQGPTRVERG